jgi:hypothetical protein
MRRKYRIVERGAAFVVQERIAWLWSDIEGATFGCLADARVCVVNIRRHEGLPLADRIVEYHP